MLLLGRALEAPLGAGLARGLQECVPTTRAGFARQGAKEKQLLKEGNAFNVSSFVLRAMMSGQYWPEGDEVYHAELTVPVLLVHGMHDKFVPVEEDQRMAEVGPWHLSPPPIPCSRAPGGFCLVLPGKGELRLRVQSRTWGCPGQVSGLGAFPTAHKRCSAELGFV